MRPAPAFSPVTEVPVLHSSTTYSFTPPSPNVHAAVDRVPSLPSSAELNCRCTSRQPEKRWYAVSWSDHEGRRVVETMDKIRALIVDDSSVMRKIVERSLRQAGIDLDKAVEASNGAEALIALQNNVVDLILCDINMPVMDGLEFVRQVHTVESAKGVPIVMITTEGSESHVVQALTAGARGYIRKPFTPDQVKEHVLPLLGKKS